jgi:hypothetical protein
MLAKVGMELRVEDDAISTEVRADKCELGTILGREKLASFDAVTGRKGVVERGHVAVMLPRRGSEDECEREAQKALQPLFETPVFGTGVAEVEGIEEGSEAVKAYPTRLVGEGRDPGKKGAVGAEGDWNPEFRAREVDGEVGLGAEPCLSYNRGSCRALVGKATKNEGLCGEESFVWAPRRVRVFGGGEAGRPHGFREGGQPMPQARAFASGFDLAAQRVSSTVGMCGTVKRSGSVPQVVAGWGAEGKR